MGLPAPPLTDPRLQVVVTPPNPVEEVLFESTYPVQVDGQKWRVYVTNRRMVFHRSIGLLSSRESRQDVDLDTVKNLTLQREKTLLKEYYLGVDGVVIKGRRSDLVNLQRAVQKVKPSVGGL